MGELVKLDINTVVEGWRIDGKLGEGAFGAVYICSKHGKQYALKAESVNEKVGFLKMELTVLSKLKEQDRTRHFCKIEDKGRHKDFFYIVMTIVGRSLQDLRLEAPKKRFSLGTAISVGIKCLEALEDLHNVGYLHRDVKPGNFAIGRPESNELRNVTLSNLEDGTVKYAPLSAHILRELCRKDDVESWLYMVVELTTGKLPWRNMTDINMIGVCKKQCRKDKLKKLFGGCPRRYIDVLRINDESKFFDTPEYEKIYELLNRALKETKSQEYPYDWETPHLENDDRTKTFVVSKCTSTHANPIVDRCNANSVKPDDADDHQAADAHDEATGSRDKAAHHNDDGTHGKATDAQNKPTVAQQKAGSGQATGEQDKAIVGQDKPTGASNAQHDPRNNEHAVERH